MNFLIRGIVLFAVLAPLTLTGQVAALYNPHQGGRAQRHKASLVPPPQPPAPEVVDPLPLPLAPLTSEELPAQPPRVVYGNGVLTVDAQNSTLSDILRAISKSTGTEFDPMPDASERTVIHLSGSPSEVVSGLLRGSTFGYVLVSSQEDSAILQKVLLIAPEPVKGAKSVVARAMTPRPTPARTFSEPVAEPTPIEPASPAPVIPAPETTAMAAPPTSLADVPPISYPRQQGGVEVPDPAQFIEQANQQNALQVAQNPDKSQQQTSGTNQYLQELYKLRVAQQPGQAPSSAATQQ